MKKLCLQRLVTLAKKREESCRCKFMAYVDEHEGALNLSAESEYIKMFTELKEAMDLVALLTSEEYFNDVCSTFGVE